jgi:predicted transcriptional regulator
MRNKQANPSTIRFSPQIAADLKLVAAESNVPRNRIVSIAVEQYLAQIKNDQAAA